MIEVKGFKFSGISAGLKKSGKKPVILMLKKRVYQNIKNTNKK